MATGAWLASQAPVAWHWLDRQFPVRRIEVAGDLEADQARELGQWLAHRVQGGLLTVDLGGLRRAAKDRPWVREVRLRRSWPDTVSIRVQWHRAEARWRPADSKAWRLVSKRGVVFQPDASHGLGELPALVGARERLDELRQRLQTLRRRLGPGLTPTAIAVDARGGWTTVVNGRVRIRFGRHRWTHRLDRLMRVQKAWDLLEHGVARVDLRHLDGLAVAVWEGPKQGAGGSKQAETGGSLRTARR